MEPTQFRKIQLALKSFFYKIRFNVAVYSVLKSPNYIQFRQRMYQAMQKQFFYMATQEKIENIVTIAKAEKADYNKLLKRVVYFWIPLTQFIKESDFKSYLEWSANKGGQVALDKLKVDKEFKLKDKVILSNIGKRIKESVKMIDGTSQEWVAQTIQKSMESNLSSYETAKLLRDNLRRVSDERAELISEHEAILQINELELEVYKRNGITTKRLITSRDERVCPVCKADEDVKDIDIKEQFPSGLLFPPLHYRCRCMIVPSVIKDNVVEWYG